MCYMIGKNGINNVFSTKKCPSINFSFIKIEIELT